MMFALIALVQSAFACGPYGPSAFSDDGAWAFEDGETVVMYGTDGARSELPVYGEVVDMDFLGEDLLIAYVDEDSSFVVRFDQDGVEVDEWTPWHSDATIERVQILREGLVITTVADDFRTRHRLTDDLRRWPTLRAPLAFQP